MSPFTRPFRASIIARARFVEDLVEEEVERGVAQYVILGAGLDTFAQRRPDITSQLRVFEIDQPGHASKKSPASLSLNTSSSFKSAITISEVSILCTGHLCAIS